MLKFNKSEESLAAKDEFKKKLSQKLKEHRMELKYTQRQCAKEIGTSLVTYQNWESGIGLPNDTNLARICKFLGIDGVDLF